MFKIYKQVKMKDSTKALFYLYLILATSTVLTLALPINLLLSTLLFFAIPSLFISIKRPDIVWRAAKFSFCISIISIVTDYLAEKDQSWTSSSMFSFRILNTVPIEAIIWVFLFTYLIIAYYQFFFKKTFHKINNKKMAIVYIACLLVIIWLIAATLLSKFSLKIEFFYIKSGISIILLPLIIFLIIWPRYIKRFLMMMPYFVILGISNLLVSLEKNYWAYPGKNFIAVIQFSTFRLPLEELIFWIILYPSFTVALYEILNNDNLKLKTVKKYIG